MTPPARAVGSKGLWFAAGFSSASSVAVLLWPTPDEDLARYVEVRDWTRGAYVRALGEDEVLDHALRGIASGLDPYSAWYTRSELVQLDRETEGRYHGLGISLRPPVSAGRILFPLPGSPAEAAGIQPGDRIVRVAGRDFAELGHARFRALVSTPEPTDVELVLAALDGSERDVVVRTQSIVEPSVRHGRMLDRSRGIGYVAVRGFSHETPGELDAALERLGQEGLTGLILDLRANPGGVLNAAVEVTSRFLPSGVVVRTAGRREREEREVEAGHQRWIDLPLALLVDGESASASEVVAGALQDHRRAVLVGSPTFGKGVVQTIHRLADASGAIKVTTSRYETPAGQRLDRAGDGSASRGLVPDLVVDVDPGVEGAIHEFLARPGPPERWLGLLREWERREGLVLLPEPPPDPVLEAARRLFTGHRPGPRASADDA